MRDYEKAIELNPKNPLFYLNRARSYLYMESYDSAIADCNRTYDLKYRTEQVFIIRGIAYRETEQFENSLRDFDRAIRKNPENTTSYVQRGTVFMDLQKPDSAIIDFNRAISINPEDTYAVFNRALARMEISDTTGAFEDLNTVLDRSPRNSYAYYNRAILYIGQKKMNLALDDLDRVIALNPDNIVVYLYRGRIRAINDDLQGALDDFTKAIEIYPEFADAYYERSLVKKQMLDLKGAEEDYRLAYAINEFNFQRSDSTKIQEEMYLRRLMAFSGEFTDNRKPSDKLQDKPVDIELQPVFTTVLFARSTESIRFYDPYGKTSYLLDLLSLTNDPDQISPWLTEAELIKLEDSLKTRKADFDQYLKKAELQFELQDYRNALEDYENAIRINPSMVRAFFGRANAKLKLIEMAVTEREEYYLFDASTEFSQASGPKSATEQEYGFDEVMQDFDRVIELDPEFYFAWYNRGYVKALSGNYWGAIHDFTQAFELNPDFAEARYNKGLLLIYLNLKAVGCKDLSIAGELGISEAYPVLKRYCTK
jgi:tetratricopeptide (TPR) repeat protein